MEQKIKVIHCSPGHYVTVPGQSLTGFYIVQSGSFYSMDRGSKEKTTLMPGDFFGIESCLTEKAYQKTNYASEESTILLVGKDQFVTLFKDFPSVGIKVMNYFSQTLRKINERDSETLSSQEEDTVEEQQSEDERMRTLLEAGSFFFNQKSGLSCSFKIYSLILNDYSKSLAKDLEDVVQNKLHILRQQGVLPQKEIDNETGLVELAPRRLVFAEGEVGKHLFIIEKGSIDIFRIISQKKVILARLEEGEVFGEMALLESKPRSAGAMSGDTPVILRSIHQGQFNRLIETSPNLSVRLATLFANRIRETNRRHMNHRINDSTARVYDLLLLELERLNVDTESASPYILLFSARAICEMAGLNEAKTNGVMSQMIHDTNLGIYEKEIAIKNLFALKKKAYFHLNEAKIKEAAELRKEPSGLSQEIGSALGED